MTRIFVDTGAFCAIHDAADDGHVAAVAYAREAARAGRGLVTSDYVVDETLTLVRKRLGHAEAVKLGERFRSTRWVEVVDVTPTIREMAWDMFKRYADQSFSFTDCTSFALMRELGIDEAFTFDRRHFGAAGFVAVPAPVGT